MIWACATPAPGAAMRATTAAASSHLRIEFSSGTVR
jgi:hypothetical protein